MDNWIEACNVGNKQSKLCFDRHPRYLKKELDLLWQFKLFVALEADRVIKWPCHTSSYAIALGRKGVILSHLFGEVIPQGAI